MKVIHRARPAPGEESDLFADAGIVLEQTGDVVIEWTDHDIAMIRDGMVEVCRRQAEDARVGTETMLDILQWAESDTVKEPFSIRSCVERYATAYDVALDAAVVSVREGFQRIINTRLDAVPSQTMAETSFLYRAVA